MDYHCVLMGAVLSLAITLTTSSESCKITGMPGMPGIPGLPGRDGRNGEKGEKGDPESVQKPRSQKGVGGELGLPGPAGKRGQSGDHGPKGGPGDPGPRGERGDTKPVNMELSSAFSVARGTGEAPPSGRPIRFTTVITNINQDYNTTTGQFRCRVPGTYYFVYHASADEQLCVLIKMNERTLTTFCDRKHGQNRRQVSSGGLAVYLKKDDNVYLEATDHNRMTGTQAGNSLFSGFILHAH